MPDRAESRPSVAPGPGGLPARRPAAARPSPADREPRAAAADAELVLRARRGDAGAFGTLVQRHQDAIYRLAWRMVGPEAAEDVAQGAFLRAWVALPDFAGEAAFGTWLHRIALNGCYDHLRRRARVRLAPLDAEALAVPDGQDVAEAVVAAAEDAARRAAVADALAELSGEERALLAMRVGEGWSYERIGAALGLKINTVGTRLFRARAKLHRLGGRRLREGEGDGS